MASEVLKIPNYSDVNIAEETILDADVAVGATTATVLNAQNITANDFVVFDPGLETADILQVLSVAAKVITFTTATLSAHTKYSKIIKVAGNQIKIYRAANSNGYVPADANFSSIGSPFTLDVDQETSSYTDSGGGSDYWYKFTYYNSQSAVETPLAISPGVRGGGYGHLVSVEDIRREAGFTNNDSIDDTQISVRRDQAESEVKGICASVGYTMPLQTSSGTSYTPPIIENICRLLAAGYVMSQDYGTSVPSGEKEGNPKLVMARNLLKEITKGSLVLLDSNDQQLARSLKVSGYPDNTTKDTGSSSLDGTGEPYNIRMDKVF